MSEHAAAVAAGEDAPWGAYALSRGRRLALVAMRFAPGRGVMRRAAARRWGRPFIDVRTFDVNWRLGPFPDADPIQARLLMGGPPWKYEPQVSAFLKRALARAPAAEATYVDVGGHLGLHALPCARLAARVVAVEPAPSLARHWRVHLAVNPDLAAKVRFFSCAVGAQEATRTLYGEGAGPATFHPSLLSSREDAARSATVRVRPLLDVVREAGLARIDAMKLDVEGHEDRVLGAFLRDAPEALYPRAVVLERNACARVWRDDPVAMLTERGWRRVPDKDPSAVYLTRFGAAAA